VHVGVCACACACACVCACSCACACARAYACARARARARARADSRARTRPRPRAHTRARGGYVSLSHTHSRTLAHSHQASSPDEVALVKYARTTGLVLTDRSTTTMVLRQPSGTRVEYHILYLFPFSSDTKRMGVIVKEPQVGGVDGRILFLMKVLLF